MAELLLDQFGRGRSLGSAGNQQPAMGMALDAVDAAVQQPHPAAEQAGDAVEVRLDPALAGKNELQHPLVRLAGGRLLHYDKQSRKMYF